MAAKTTGGVVASIDPKQWAAFTARLKAVDPRMVTQLRKRIRNAGNFAVERVRATLALPSPDGGPDAGRSREALAAATKVTVNFRGKSGSAKVVTTSAGLAPEHTGLVKVYNKETFRHPVFERTAQTESRKTNSLLHRLHIGQADWVVQKGRPYMGAEFAAQVQVVATREINAAFEDAAAFLARRT